MLSDIQVTFGDNMAYVELSNSGISNFAGGMTVQFPLAILPFTSQG